MATQTKQGYCDQCHQNRMGSKEILGDGWGCLLTILTAGLFLLVWLPMKFFVEYPRPYRCQICGTVLNKTKPASD
jgi:hypothetical protein